MLRVCKPQWPCWTCEYTQSSCTLGFSSLFLGEVLNTSSPYCTSSSFFFCFLLLERLTTVAYSTSSSCAGAGQQRKKVFLKSMLKKYFEVTIFLLQMIQIKYNLRIIGICSTKVFSVIYKGVRACLHSNQP